MAKHKVDDIRNIVLVGHRAAGKTTLADAMLIKAGAVDRRGSVDEGTSVSDFDEEEHHRKFSIDTSILNATHQGKYLQILDTPGYPDFVGVALSALAAVETAVVVIAAPAGIEVNTRRMFTEAGKRGLARMLVINKLDGENIDFEQLLGNIRETFGKGCVLLNAPVGIGAGFKGVVDVLNSPASPPADVSVDLATARGQLMDAIVEVDEAMMEKYLAEEPIPPEQLNAAIPKAMAAGSLIPILCTCAKKDIGIVELLDAIAGFAPSPADGLTRKATPKGDGEPVTLKASESGDFIGQVFKTINDKFVGNLSYIRAFSGRLTPENHLINVRTGDNSRLPGLLRIQGKANSPLTDAVAGDIFAVAKVEGLKMGDTVSTSANAPRLPQATFPVPMFGLAVEPKARGDEQKLSGSLHKIVDEDPCFRVSHDAATKELVISGTSQLHLDVIQNRLKRRYNLEIVTKEPKIAYRETISTSGEADHRHKKQSGGRGQFGEVHLRVYPLDRGIHSEEQLLEQFANKSRFEKMRSAHYHANHNFAFIDHIVGGTIPNQFIPACEKGCLELVERGALAGYPMQDVAVEVHFGKDHPVDSSEAAFKTAARMAFKKAFLAARPVLLEPIVTLEVTCPTQYTGSILGDLTTKRARVENQDSLPGNLAVITAKAPLAEVTRYQAQLNGITQGQGSFTMEFSHYDQVPGNVQQQIVAKSKVAADEEE
ncbi:MAG TPA: elongation factor G [Gemmataceae bacterium]|jgi:elongation factor G|nr:elongation factor G [Gemmataceae bacterium]